MPVALPTGGVNLSAAPSELESDETLAMRNYTPRPYGMGESSGLLSVRENYDFVSYGAIGSVDNVIEFPDNELVVSANGDIYHIDGGTVTLLFNGTSGTVWSFAVTRDAVGKKLWAMNGTDAPQKWDGAATVTSAWANSPPNGTAITAWKGRIVVAGVAANLIRLYYSNVGDPEAPAASYGNNNLDLRVNVTDPEDEVNVGLIPVGDNLLVFKKGTMVLIYDPVAFTNRVVAMRGITDFRAAAELNGRVYFVSGDSVVDATAYRARTLWSTDGTDLTMETPQFYGYGNNIAVDRYRHKLYTIYDGGLDYEWVEVDLLNHNKRKSRPVFIHRLADTSVVFTSVGFARDSVLLCVSGGVWESEKSPFAMDDGEIATAIVTFRPLTIQSREPVERIRRLTLGYSGGFDVHTGPATGTVYVKSSTSGLLTPSEALVTANYDFNEALTESDAVGGYAEDTVKPERRGRYHQIAVKRDAGALLLASAEVVYRGGREKK